jgi:hypothetical protein
MLTKLWPKYTRRNHSLDYIGVDGRAILKWFVENQGVKLWKLMFP